MKLLYWRAFPVQRGGKHYYRFVWKLFGEHGIPVWCADRLDTTPRPEDAMNWRSDEDTLRVYQDLMLYGNAMIHVANINGEIVARRMELPDGSEKARYHADLVSVLRELVYGGGGHAWTRARELLAAIQAGTSPSQ